MYQARVLDPLGAGTTGGCDWEPTGADAGTQTQVLCKSSPLLTLSRRSPGPKRLHFIRTKYNMQTADIIYVCFRDYQRLDRKKKNQVYHHPHL